MFVVVQRIIEVGKKKGSGGYGQVFEGTFREYNTTTPVALKRAQQSTKPEERDEYDKVFKDEAENLEEFAHLFVVKFFGVWQFDDHK